MTKPVIKQWVIEGPITQTLDEGKTWLAGVRKHIEDDQVDVQIWQQDVTRNRFIVQATEEDFQKIFADKPN
jgi:hypothetical protein